MNEVIKFWFEEIEPKQHWVKDAAFDAQIKTRFLDVHGAANNGELYEWRETAQGRLAEIIVLDQFSRNMYRDESLSFSSDTLALVLAQEAVSAGADNELNQMEKSFLYMPYMHSESLLIHEVGLELFTKNGVEGTTKFEIKHKNIIEKFGRYPHRNSILGRVSTKEEIEFLKQPGSGF